MNLADPNLPVLDPAVMVDLFGADDRSLFCKILSSFESKDGPDTQTLADQMGRGDHPRDLAHKLKSSSRAIGALRLSDLYQRIEKGDVAPSKAAAEVILQEFLAATTAIQAYCAE